MTFSITLEWVGKIRVRVRWIPIEHRAWSLIYFAYGHQFSLSFKWRSKDSSSVLLIRIFFPFMPTWSIASVGIWTSIKNFDLDSFPIFWSKGLFIFK